MIIALPSAIISQKTLKIPVHKKIKKVLYTHVAPKPYPMSLLSPLLQKQRGSDGMLLPEIMMDTYDGPITVGPKIP